MLKERTSTAIVHKTVCYVIRQILSCPSCWMYDMRCT